MSASTGRVRATAGGLLVRIRLAVSALVAGVLGVLPHVLHHVGPLAGAAILGGVGGALIFGAAGLALSLPFLVRIRRRTGSWRIPVVLLTTFALVFAVSNFVVGPAISGSDDRPTPPDPPAHQAHH